MFSFLRRSFISAAIRGKPSFLFATFESNCDAFLKCKPVILNVRFKHRVKSIVLRESPPPSRYHPGSRIEATEETIISTLNNKTSMNEDDWNDFKMNMMTDIELITDKNFDSIIMNCLLLSNKLDLAHSFLKYLENQIVKPNFLTYLKYIELCGKNHKQIKQELILETFDKIRHLIDESPVLDMKSVESIVHGLCATNQWRDSFEYLKKLTQSPSLAIHDSLACGAIRNGDETFAWNVLTTWIKGGESPSDRLFQEFVSVALDMQKQNPRASDVFINKLFQYMHAKDVTVSVDVAKLIERYFICHPSKWIISTAKVSRTGYCEKCEYALKMLDLTNEEFNKLKNAFLECSVKKSDVFINTTRKEFDNYMNFIEKNKPFHIVVDGLNAAFTYPFGKSSKNLAFQLLKITKLLAGRSRNLLILGKKHMKGWPAYPMKKISERAKIFYTDNISQDDPFLIYAALASGPHTHFLSSDLMRDHMSRLDDPQTINLFQRWQQSHQIFVQSDKDFNLKFIEPVKHCISVQGSMEKGLHIPFDDKIILDPYEELNNWLCIKRHL